VLGHFREVIDAKLKGEGLEPIDEEEPDRGKVIDLMGALRRTLGQEAWAPARTKPAAQKKTAAKKEPERKAPEKKGSGGATSRRRA